MIRNRILLKTFAVFFIVEMTTSIMAPTISWALTAGPTAPEATSFEPVDTTDMVNLITGDLVYNLPLIEVPGSSGGYPLSLSYHAGIQPDVDASWVGLGMTLNPGSISRLVNGYADDNKDAIVTNHYYWGGRTRDTYSIGISTGVGGMGQVTAGLAFTQDSNNGFSVNPYAMASGSIGPIGIQASSDGTAQMTFPGMDYYNMIQNNTLSVSQSLGKYGDISGSSSGINYSKSVGLLSMDVSISSKGVKPKLSVGGFSKGVSREGIVNTETINNSINIPTPWDFSVHLGRDYIRKWIDESSDVKTNGALYYPTSKPDYSYMTKRAYDTYDISTETTDAEKDTGGSFPDYDNYSVNAQGLSGNIRPYHYYEYLYRQNREDNGQAIVRNAPLGVTGNPVGFRFINEFSNRFLFEPGIPNYDYNTGDFSMSFPTGQITAGLDGDGYKENKLAGSKHIEQYTNNDITNTPGPKSKGFIDCVATGFQRSLAPGEQIGGFKITTENGMTYHFALPAYSFGEYSYSEKIKQKIEEYNEVTRSQKYAYTWFLSAITGPDYVDRSSTGEPNGILDENDWGYWVEFGYQKYNANYHWRNPSEGFNKDIDNNFQNFSRGNKELYYLDYIRTDSHIAIFEKSERLDGRGVAGVNGGFTSISAKTCKLDNIYLLNFDDFKAIGGFDIIPQLSANHTMIKSKSYRSISFSTDYSLCPKTPNSFADSNPNIKLGKLTLNALTFYGKGGEESLPPTKFNYEVNSPKTENVTLIKNTSGSTKRLEFYSPFIQWKVGDIVKIQTETESFIYYGLITAQSDHYFNIKIIYGDDATLQGSVLLTETKNPPYDKEKVDMWGLYKSDYDGRNVSRYPTDLSVHNIDAWSLRSIRSSLGAKINIEYESDDYNEVVLAKQQGLRISNAVKEGSSLRLFFFDDGLDIQDYFEPNTIADVLLIGGYGYEDRRLLTTPPNGCDCPGGGDMIHQYFLGRDAKITSIDLASNSITIENSLLVSDLSSTRISYVDPEQTCFGDFACSYQVDNGWPSFVVGGVMYSHNKYKLGGGIRVKKIGVEQYGGRELFTNYQYFNGVTSYEPVAILKLEANPSYLAYFTNQERKGIEYQEASLLFQRASWNGYQSLINIAREVPGPGVMYNEVEVRSSLIDENHIENTTPTHQKYSFQTYNIDFVQHVPVSKEFTSPSGVSDHNEISGLKFNNLVRAEVKLNDLSTAIGNIKSISTIDDNGNMLSTKEFEYLHDKYIGDFSAYENALGKHFQQGLIKESFADGRLIKNSGLNNGYSLYAVMSKRQSYPIIQTKQITKNFKNGITTEAITKAFDFFSGEVTQTVATDGYGNTYVNEVTPAYKKYSAMGLAINGGKNMLTQEAATFTYRIDPTKGDEKKGLVSASVQTWSDQIQTLEPGQFSTFIIQNGIWRKQSAYSFIGDNTVALSGDGLYPIEANTLPLFNSWNGMTNPSLAWQKNGEITMYDVNSHALEAIDINQNYAATKMTFDQTKVIASAVNSSYNEFSYSGGEDDVVDDAIGDHIRLMPDASISSDISHTGNKSIKVNGIMGIIYENLLQYNRRYHVSVWTNSSQALLKYIDDHGDTRIMPTTLKAAGSWYLLSGSFLRNAVHGANSNFKVWCERVPSPGASVPIYFDDFRLSPDDAVMTSYVYNEWGELTHILDNNNLYTEYRYDGMGRLKETYKETFKAQYGAGGIAKISDVSYNYGQNHPFMLMLNATSTGMGDIQPVGVTPVPLNGEKNFILTSPCSARYISSVEIDGKSIERFNSSQSLPDGTKIFIDNSQITFKNLKGPHSIVVNFLNDEYDGIYNSPSISCYNPYQSTGSGTDCYDGSYEYMYYDDCLENLTRVVVTDWHAIPYAIRKDKSSDQYNCCSYNAPGSDCNCNSH